MSTQGLNAVRCITQEKMGDEDLFESVRGRGMTQQHPSEAYGFLRGSYADVFSPVCVFCIKSR